MEESTSDDENKHHNGPPPHVKALMIPSKGSAKRVTYCTKTKGMLTCSDVQAAINETVKSLPRFKDDDLRLKEGTRALPSKMSLAVTQPAPPPARFYKPSAPIKITVESKGAARVSAHRRREFDKMISHNLHGKIAFIPPPFDMRSIPLYVTSRLETACRTARYELPLDMKSLEDMTQVEYLTKYTRLYKEQRDRYEKIFKRFKHRTAEHLDLQVRPLNMYVALNSMFGGFLSKQNYEILCTALYMEEHTTIDLNMFIAVCTFCDRLYWTAYLDGSNAFNYWGLNRSAMEVIDFSNLAWKLHGVKISKELKCLLFSLA